MTSFIENFIYYSALCSHHKDEKYTLQYERVKAHTHLQPSFLSHTLAVGHAIPYPFRIYWCFWHTWHDLRFLPSFIFIVFIHQRYIALLWNAFVFRMKITENMVSFGPHSCAPISIYAFSRHIWNGSWIKTRNIASFLSVCLEFGYALHFPTKSVCFLIEMIIIIIIIVIALRAPDTKVISCFMQKIHCQFSKKNSLHFYRRQQYNEFWSRSTWVKVRMMKYVR